MKKIPIIIDCDPGVDDAYAIALANSYEGFDIKAITAVAGNVELEMTKLNALAIADLLKIDCRVGVGAELPMYKEYLKRKGSSTHGVNGLGNIIWGEINRGYDEKPAWDIIYEEAKQAEGELVLFAVGPLTNIALALLKYPDLPKYIKKFVIMGGGTVGNVASTNRTAEFNIWVDPTAARICFQRLEVYMVGINATHAAALTPEDFDGMIEACGDGENAHLAREMSTFSKENAFERGSDSNVIHDALAVATMMDDSVVKWEHYYVFTEDEPQAINDGQTVIDLEGKSGYKPNCYVAMEVDNRRFAKIMLDMCTYYGKL